MTNHHLRRTLDALRDLDHLNTRAMSHSMRERTTRADEIEEEAIRLARLVAYTNLDCAIRADIHLLRQGFTLEELKKALD